MINVSSVIPKIIWLLSAATLASQLALVLALVFCLLGLYKKEYFKKYFSFLYKHALFFAFLIAVVAAAGSLFFSEIAQFEPCKLCWWQRIFLYPQVILLGAALWRKDFSVRLYAILLSLIGAGIAGYQTALSWLAPASPLGVCSVTGPSCVTNYFTEFGYITTPLMSLTSFVLIIVLLSVWKTDQGFNNSLE